MTLGDVPSQGIASVLTPDPTERTNVVSISNTFKQIGFSACVVIVPIACLIIPGGSKVLVKSGETDLPMIANEYLFTAVLGCVLFGLIPLLNKERVPYTAGDKISFKDMMGALKSNKPFMLVIISYFLGFGRQMAMGIQVQAANILLGSQNLVAVLGISTAIGTMISMAACPFLIKKLDEKKVFIGLSVYGFIASVLSFVIAHFWFTNPDNMVLTVLFYFSLFLMGLQFASVNLMPMIMTADCVDYYEYETGKRMEGTAYSVLTLTIKICLALGTALGLVFVQVSGYSDTVRRRHRRRIRDKDKGHRVLRLRRCPRYSLPALSYSDIQIRYRRQEEAGDIRRAPGKKNRRSRREIIKAKSYPPYGFIRRIFCLV